VVFRVYFFSTLVLSMYLVFIGIIEYREFQKAKQVFIKYEKLKVKTFANYEQYGAFGFKVLMDVSPLSIFFDSGDTMRMTKSNIDTFEVIDVVSSKRGEWKSKEFFRPISLSAFFLLSTGILFFLIGALIPGKKALKLSRKFFSNIIAIINRFAIVESLCLLLLLGLYVLIRLKGISFNGDEIKVLCSFVLYSISFHVLAFFAGCLIRIFTLQNKTKTLIAGLFVGLAVIIITPGLNMYLYDKYLHLEKIEEVFYKKLETLMQLEREVNQFIQKKRDLNDEQKLEIFKKAAGDFIATGLKENEKTELVYLDEMKGLTALKERVSLFWPLSYGLHFTRELSLEGDRQHFDFMVYNLKIKKDFTLFYVHKRYYTNEWQVESFVKNGENVFPFNPVMLTSFKSAVLINFLYSFFLFVATMVILRVKTTAKGKVSFLEWTPQKGVFFYKLCDNDEERDSAFKYFQSLNRYTCIDNENEDLLAFAGMRIADVIGYEAFVMGVNRASVEKLLETFDIKDLSTTLGPKNVKKVYISLMLDEPKKEIIINDFCKNLDSDFYNQLQSVFDGLLKEGKSILYLGSDMFTGSKKLETLINSDIATVDIMSISLR